MLVAPLVRVPVGQPRFPVAVPFPRFVPVPFILLAKEIGMAAAVSVRADHVRSILQLAFHRLLPILGPVAQVGYGTWVTHLWALKSCTSVAPSEEAKWAACWAGVAGRLSPEADPEQERFLFIYFLKCSPEKPGSGEGKQAGGRRPPSMGGVR